MIKRSILLELIEELFHVFMYKYCGMLHVIYLFNKAIHLFTPLNECIPMPVSIFKSIRISNNE